MTENCIIEKQTWIGSLFAFLVAYRTGIASIFLLLSPMVIAPGWVELSYAIAGSEVIDAKVIQAINIWGQDGPTGHAAVSYRFYDSKLNRTRNEKSFQSSWWEIPEGSIRVEYIPGAVGESRIADSFRFWFAIGPLFFWALSGAVFLLIIVLYEFGVLALSVEKDQLKVSMEAAKPDRVAPDQTRP